MGDDRVGMLVALTNAVELELVDVGEGVDGVGIVRFHFPGGVTLTMTGDGDENVPALTMSYDDPRWQAFVGIWHE